MQCVQAVKRNHTMNDVRLNLHVHEVECTDHSILRITRFVVLIGVARHKIDDVNGELTTGNQACLHIYRWLVPEIAAKL